MSDYKLKPTVTSVRSRFATLFERIMVLYNLNFLKEEKDHKVEDVKKFTIELYEAGRINEYIKEIIDHSIELFALLLSGHIKKRCVDLEYLETFASLYISDINSEIGELIH